MAITDDVVRRLTVVAKTTGVQEAASDLKKMATAQAEVVTSSEQVTKATAYAQAAYGSARAKVVDLHEAYNKQQRLLNNYNDTIGITNRMSQIQIAGLSGLGVAFKELQTVITPLQPALIGLGVGFAGFIAASAAIGYVAKNAADAIAAFSKLEDNTVRVQNVLQLTASASGKTASQIEKLATSFANVNEAREAAQALLQFNKVSGEVYDRALKSAANLSATGFGSLASSARAIGQALQDPINNVKTFSDVFTYKQQQVIQTLVETGKVVEAQQMILDALERRLGGTSAASSGTLSGAWAEVAKQTQLGQEAFGQSITSITHLTTLVYGLAKALEFLNSVDIGKIAGVLGGLALSPGATLYGLGKDLIYGKPKEATPELFGLSGPETGAASVAKLRARQDAIDRVTDSVNREIEAGRKSEVQNAINKALVDAQVESTSREGQEIARLVTQKFQEATARAEAKKAAEEEARATKQSLEFMRRDAEERDAYIEKLKQETTAIFQSEQAARSAALANERLAKYKVRGVVVSDDLEREVRLWAEQAAAIEQVNKELRQIKDAATDFVTTLVEGLARGQNLSQSLQGALSGLSSTLIKVGTQQLVGNLFQGGSSILGGAAGATGGASGGGLIGSLLGGLGLASSLAGPVGAGLAIGGGLLASFLSNNSQKKAQQQAAQQQAAEALLQQQQEAARKAQEQADAAQNYRFQAKALGFDTNTKSGAFGSLEVQIAQERIQAIKTGGEAIIAFEEYANAKRLQLEKEWNEKIEAARQSYLDRIFAATNDDGTIQGKLAAYDRKALQERQDAIKEFGQIAVELEQAQAAERNKIIKDSLKEQTDYYDSLKTSIADFTRGLKYGDLSTLSPAQQYLSARNDYQTQLDLALGGNRTAQGNITNVAQTLIEQARNYLGPSVEFGNLVDRITQQLNELPSIAQGNDPQVQELIRLGSDYLSPLNDQIAGLREESKNLQLQVVSLLSANNEQSKTIAALTEKLGVELRQGLEAINIKAAS